MSKTLSEAVDELGKTLHGIFDPLLLPFVRWLDRQLRRWPWLYRRLGGEA